MSTALLPSAGVHTSNSTSATASLPSPPANFLVQFKRRASASSIQSLSLFLKEPFVLVSAVAGSWARGNYFGGGSRKRSREQQEPSTPLPSPPATVDLPSISSSSLAFQSLVLLASKASSSSIKGIKSLPPKPQQLVASLDFAVQAQGARPPSLLPPPSTSLLPVHQNDVLPSPTLPSPIPIPVQTTNPQKGFDPTSEYVFEWDSVPGRAQRQALGFYLAIDRQQAPTFERKDYEAMEGPGSIRALTILNKHLRTLLELFVPPPRSTDNPFTSQPSLLSTLTLLAMPASGARWGEVAREVLLSLDMLSRIKEGERKEKWVKSYLRWGKEVVGERLREEWTLLDKERVLPARAEISLDQWRSTKVTDILVQIGSIIDHEASSSLDILVFRGSFDSFVLQDHVVELSSYDQCAAMAVRELVGSGCTASDVATKLYRMARQIQAARRNSESPIDSSLPNPKRLAQMLAPLLAKPASPSSSSSPVILLSTQRKVQPTASISFCTVSSVDDANSTSFLIPPPSHLIRILKPARRPSPSVLLPSLPPLSPSSANTQPKIRGSATQFVKRFNSQKQRRSSQLAVFNAPQDRTSSPLLLVPDADLPHAEVNRLSGGLKIEAGPSSLISREEEGRKVASQSKEEGGIVASSVRSKSKGPTRGRSMVAGGSKERGRASRRC